MKIRYTVTVVMKESGFREIEHTADWELEVWAHDLPALLEQAARGMYALAGVKLSQEPRVERVFALQFHDPETLLVKFLDELLYLAEEERLGFDLFQLILAGDSLRVLLLGAPILSQDREIKAVTYHNLLVKETETGLQVRVVFDV